MLYRKDNKNSLKKEIIKITSVIAFFLGTFVTVEIGIALADVVIEITAEEKN